MYSVTKYPVMIYPVKSIFNSNVLGDNKFSDKYVK